MVYLPDLLATIVTISPFAIFRITANPTELGLPGPYPLVRTPEPVHPPPILLHQPAFARVFFATSQFVSVGLVTNSILTVCCHRKLTCYFADASACGFLRRVLPRCALNATLPPRRVLGPIIVLHGERSPACMLPSTTTSFGCDSIASLRLGMFPNQAGVHNYQHSAALSLDARRECTLGPSSFVLSNAYLPLRHPLPDAHPASHVDWGFVVSGCFLKTRRSPAAPVGLSRSITTRDFSLVLGLLNKLSKIKCAMF